MSRPIIMLSISIARLFLVLSLLPMRILAVGGDHVCFCCQNDQEDNFRLNFSYVEDLNSVNSSIGIFDIILKAIGSGENCSLPDSKEFPQLSIIYEEDQISLKEGLDSIFMKQENEYYSAQHFQISSNSSEVNSTSILSSLHNEQRHVFMLIDNADTVLELFKALCTDTLYNWSYIKHSTRWIVFSRNPEMIPRLTNAYFPLVDFLLSIVSSEDLVQVAMKARTSNVEIVFPEDCPINDDVEQTDEEWADVRGWYPCQTPANGPPSPEHSCYNLNRLDKFLFHFDVHDMEGIHLKVGAIVMGRQVGPEGGDLEVGDNAGVHLAFISDSIMAYMAEKHKFTYSYLVPGSNTYGGVSKSGQATGVIGLLSDKRAAICAVPLYITLDRSAVVDVLASPVSANVFNVIFMAQKSSDGIDSMIFDVVATDFVLLSLGPLIIFTIISAIVHVFTNGCQEKEPLFPINLGIRSLTSFPAHVTFHDSPEYAGQTGRILRASWAVFWLIFSCSFSAHLVTVFTIEKTGSAVDLVTLLSKPDFEFGVDGIAEAIHTYLPTSSRPELRDYWERVKTSSEALSRNSTRHFERVFEGNYAFMAAYRREDIGSVYPTASIEQLQNIVALEVMNRFMYIALPKGAFFRETLGVTMSNMVETGIMETIKGSFYSKSVKIPDFQSQDLAAKSIPLEKLYILFISLAGGILVASVSLFLEWLLFHAMARSGPPLPSMLKRILTGRRVAPSKTIFVANRAIDADG